METFKSHPALHFPTRQDFRRWLEENHATATALWVIQFKQASGVECVGYAEAVEEALCFGWIDSVKYKRDEASSYQYFAPRKEGSNWAKSNRERVERLIAQGLMRPEGMRHVETAKESGAWTALEKVERLEIPDDLLAALDANPAAKENFERFPKSAKMMILEWIYAAKREETRAKRVLDTVSKAAENVRAR